MSSDADMGEQSSAIAHELTHCIQFVGGVEVDFDGALVGFHDGDDVTMGHHIARLLEPLGQGRGRHIGAQLRHQEISHRRPPG